MRHRKPSCRPIIAFTLAWTVPMVTIRSGKPRQSGLTTRSSKESGKMTAVTLSDTYPLSRETP